jgi:hypothetical protein
MALRSACRRAFVGGPLNGQIETHEMHLIWDHNGNGLVWREYVAEDEPVPSLDTPMDTPVPATAGYSVINHRYVMKCLGSYHIGNCWLKYAGVVS